MDFLRRIPPCPDPDRYVWVETKTKGYWRKKRGTVKEAKLNPQLGKNMDNTRITAPAAKRVVRKLRPMTVGMKTACLCVNISTRLRTAMYEDDQLHFGYLKDLELQANHPLSYLLDCSYTLNEVDGYLTVSIPIDRYTLRRTGALVTNYFFDLVVLSGDVTVDNGLRMEEDQSDLFAAGENKKSVCRLSLPVPQRNWMALLKLSCMEGNEFAAAPRHYAMKIVAVK